MQHELHTEIAIEASPEVVWEVLIDLDGYRDWNPFIVEAAGTPVIGERLTNRLQPPGAKAMTFKPEVTEVAPHSVFEWLGRLVLPRIFDGRHRFELQSTASGGTTVRHSEYFRGVLVRFVRSSLDTNTRAGFETMNEALKARAEAFARSGS